jgi:hypothetical protein
MAQLTWLGEDELHDGAAGPSFTTAFGGIKFPKGEAVEVSDEEIVAKARNNQYFACRTTLSRHRRPMMAA